MSGDAKQATPGKCDPKPVCISNPLTLNITASNQQAFPACINIHRCDGCCPPDEECVATVIDVVKLSNVYMFFYDGLDSPQLEERIISASNHTDCECRCKWKSDDDCKKVNQNFVKIAGECKCGCRQELACRSKHEFDEKSCSCVCRRSAFSKMEDVCRLRNYAWNAIECKCEARPK